MDSKLILLIEPDQVLGAAYARSLEHSGFELAIARNADQAMLLIDERRPDLIICELQLVSHSGIELLYELRSYADWMSIAVIVLSIVPPSEFSASQHGLTKQLGVNCYLYKPTTNIRQLVRAAQETLSIS